jgi:uncharacterized protein involved in cysteine biosynthesis
MLSVTVYTVYTCLKYTSIAAAGIGLVLSFIPSVRGWKAHVAIMLILSLMILCIQAYYFPRS